MAFARPFAYNTGSPIAGTEQVGNLAVGTPTSGFTGMEWWNGPDEELGYVIAIPVSADTQPTPISGVTASVGFDRTPSFSDSEFVQLANLVSNQSYTGATQASSGLTSLGYWNSYGQESSIRYIGISTQTGNPSVSNPYSFTNVNVGETITGNKSLLVIIAGTSKASAFQNIITSLTANGVECNLAIQSISGGTNFQNKSIYYIPWNSNSGTTATISITTPAGSNGLDIAIYRVDNIKNTTPQFTYRVSTSFTQTSWTFSGMQIGDLVIGGAGEERIGFVATNNFDWTGLTENYDLRYFGANAPYFISGANTRVTSDGNQTFTVKRIDNTNPEVFSLVSAVWR